MLASNERHSEPELFQASTKTELWKGGIIQSVNENREIQVQMKEAERETAICR